jgi:hypothetical protein
MANPDIHVSIRDAFDAAERQLETLEVVVTDSLVHLAQAPRPGKWPCFDRARSVHRGCFLKIGGTGTATNRARILAPMPA